MTYSFRLRLRDIHGNLSNWGGVVTGTVNEAAGWLEQMANAD